MEEQFILRVPPSIAEQIEKLMAEGGTDSSSDGSLNLAFTDDGRNATFTIGSESFPASLLDLPGVVESYKTYDDSNLIKTGDVGQIIMVREHDDPSPEGVEFRHGLTPPMRDARRRRFRREPDLNPELVQQVEGDLLKIMHGGHVGGQNVGAAAGEDGAGEKRKSAPAPAAKPGSAMAAAGNGDDAQGSDSDDSG